MKINPNNMRGKMVGESFAGKKGMGLSPLFEDAGNLKHLPDHWVRMITNFTGWWNTGGAIGGKDSQLVDVDKPYTNRRALRNALNKDGSLATIINVNGEPTYMIVRRSERKYWLLKKEPDNLRPKSMGATAYGVYGARHPHGENAEMQLTDIYREIERDNVDPEDTSLTVVMPDPTRIEKGKERRERGKQIDPLEQPRKFGPGEPASPKQAEIAKKYGSIKRSKYERQAMAAIEDLKDQIVQNLDDAMEEIIDDLEKGFTFNIDKKNIGKELLKNISIKDLEKYAQIYSAAKSDYSDDTPYQMYKKVKRAERGER